jgi:oligoribonuclease NrnB/cAMP/cGMP phosphodiesterase (DHH superfamily)
MIEKAHLITHAGCLDGSACAVLFVAAGGKRKNIHFTFPTSKDVENILDDVIHDYPEVPIILADVSVSKEYAKKLNYLNLVLLDHHDSSLSLSEFEWCDISTDKCGCKILYNWFMRNSINERSRLFNYKRFIDVVDDHDRWVKDPELNSDMLAMFHSCVGQKLFVSRFIKDCSLDLTSQEQYAINLETSRQKDFIKYAKKNVVIRSFDINSDNVRVGFVLANTYQSELGNSMCRDLDLNIDVAVVVGNQKVSFRALQDCPVDLSKVAILNGGGGHPLASGTALSNVIGGDLLELVANNLKWSG